MKQKEEKEEKPALPGTRKKQADALIRNVGWLAKTLGPERVAFLTSTVGNQVEGEGFVKVYDRKEAQRRLHSFLTNELSKRYQCGVIVTERHKDGGIHFHMALGMAEDIRGNMDFKACFPPKGVDGKPVRRPNYKSANAAIKREWAWLRKMAGRYGFGRQQLQPMMESGEALGCYLGKYLVKDWDNRRPEDKKARCVRYFGHWSATERQPGERRETRPHGVQFGWLKPRARAWREMLKQMMVVLRFKGAKIGQDNIKEICGPRWAWKATRLFRAVRFVIEDSQDPELRREIDKHNQEVRKRWLEGGGNTAHECWWDITEITLDHLRPSPQWQKQMDELQLAKDVEAEIKKRLRARKAKERVKQQASLFLQFAPEATWASWIERTIPADD